MRSAPQAQASDYDGEMKTTRVRCRRISAWLVTWEGVGGHVKIEEQVAAILNPRRSVDRVKDIVELLYVNASHSYVERINYAKSRKNNPYPAEFGVSHNGVPWTGEVTCGHNPFLEARLVDNLRVEGDGAPRRTEVGRTPAAQEKGSL